MHPVAHHRFTRLRGLGLCDLTLMVGEDEIHATSVDVELLPEVLTTHRRAFGMPAREAFAPGARPAHDVLGLCLLPEGEVQRTSLLTLSVELTGIGEHILDTASTEFAVVEALVVLLYIEVDRPTTLVRQACIEDTLGERYLLDDVPRGHGLDARR